MQIDYRAADCKSAVTIITASPLADSPGFFEARIGARVLCAATRMPFFDGARALAAGGYPASTVIALRHSGSDVDCLRSTIGKAAALTIGDSRLGCPKYRRWKTTPSDVAAPPVAATGNSGSSLLAAGE